MHIDVMLASLNGLSVGDALGAQFPILGTSVPELLAGRVAGRQWNWTDDTEMACSVAGELCEHGEIDQDRLAGAFARRLDRTRDYGFFAVDTLSRIGRGTPWQQAAGAVYDGQGSCGNGGAMRVAPLGACFAGDPETIVAQAVRSAQVTHMHPEGVAGAVAVALAAGAAAEAGMRGIRPAPAEFIDEILRHLSDGETARLIRHARTLLGAPAEVAAAELGNGSRVTAQDTVPLTIWIAATHLADYPSAVTTCLAADGDIDTTGAIVGGIVAAYTGTHPQPVTGIPHTWLATREPLPTWFDSSAATRRRPSGLRRWLPGRS
ncbi:ADP-ribosylglycohydrolase family protein [Nocardia sp. NPDC052254]|uniref:ADP-ribosylglycohydrolase family protein n=1 Tax=Nocardia sp. NPDC052254 TaxID=3155681 RepID=UPI0034209135